MSKHIEIKHSIRDRFYEGIVTEAVGDALRQYVMKHAAAYESMYLNEMLNELRILRIENVI